MALRLEAAAQQASLRWFVSAQRSSVNAAAAARHTTIRARRQAYTEVVEAPVDFLEAREQILRRLQALGDGA